jgi:hypothetical protein
MVISHCGLPSWVRSASVCGSRSSSRATALASAISCGVRWRMKSGCLRNMVLTAWPGSIAATSTSIEASASTSAEGFIWLISG